MMGLAIGKLIFHLLPMPQRLYGCRAGVQRERSLEDGRHVHSFCFNAAIEPAPPKADERQQAEMTGMSSLAISDLSTANNTMFGFTEI